MLVSVLAMEAGVVINVPKVAGLTLSADNSESFTYDLNANLLTISRKGRDDAGSYRVVDEIEMGYIGNLLSWLRDTAEDPLLEGSMDIPQGNYSGYDIMYDGAGRVTRDVSRGISHVNYNVTGTPFVVGTMTADCAVYGYTSSGAKLSETIYNGSVTTRRDYVGPCEYVDGKLVRINVPQGYIDSLGVLHAYIHDIQGNITGVYEAKAGKKQLEQLNEYYAYGGLTADSKGQDRNRYRHTGKELVSDLGINSYDFTARWQYPMAGAFTSPDAKAIDYKWLSPYSFCGGDPINFSDPTGNRIIAGETGGSSYEWKEVDGNWGFYDGDNNMYSGNDSFMLKLTEALMTISSCSEGLRLVSNLANNENTVFIMAVGVTVWDGNGTIGWNVNSTEGVPVEGNKIDINPTINLAHELAHTEYSWGGGENREWLREYTETDMKKPKSVGISELYTTHIENLIRNQFNLPMRTYYSKDEYGYGHKGKLIDVKSRTSLHIDINGRIHVKTIKDKSLRYNF